MKRNQTKICAALAFAALCMFWAAPSVAATEQKLRAAFAEADVNGDGVLDIDEYTGYMVRLFTSLDKNRDGFLERGDVPKTPAARFKAIDRNSDDKISLGEGVGDKVIDFFDADTDHDGVMSITELLVYERAK